MALQDIINTASNIEINRSKLVAQTVSRSGRISVASRNWANPFRFTVTPKPVWTYTEYRAIFEPIFTDVVKLFPFCKIAVPLQEIQFVPSNLYVVSVSVTKTTSSITGI